MKYNILVFILTIIFAAKTHNVISQESNVLRKKFYLSREIPTDVMNHAFETTIIIGHNEKVGKSVYLSYSKLFKHFNKLHLGYSLGFGINSVIELYEPENTLSELRKLIHVGTFCQYRPFNILSFDLGSNVSGLWYSKLEDSPPLPSIVLYVGTEIGFTRLKIGTRITGGYETFRRLPFIYMTAYYLKFYLNN